MITPKQIVHGFDEKFNKNHPFVLQDGRRFKSLYCAAQTVLCHVGPQRHALLPIINESVKEGEGRELDVIDCIKAQNEMETPKVYRGMEINRYHD